MSYNKFGIGIAAPADNLHVLGAVRFGDSSSSTNQARIYAGSTWSAWQTQAGTDAIVIRQSNGNVGIGTNPQAKFHIYNGVVNSNLYVRHSGIGAQIYGATDVGGYGTLQIDGIPLVLNSTGNSAGNVGIGTANPIRRLHVTAQALVGYNAGVSGGVYLTDTATYGKPAIQAVNNSFGAETLFINPTGGIINLGTSLNCTGNELNSTAGALYLNYTPGTGTGNVIVGTNGLQYGKLNVFGSNTLAAPALYRWFKGDSAGLLSSGLTPNPAPVSIYAEQYVWCSGYIASSDRRIKEEISEINDGEALSKLRALNPTTYKYIDKESRGDDQVYGFIAQEVKEVLPRAVSVANEYIPDVYCLGEVSVDNTITITKSHNLVVGDKVRIYLETSRDPKHATVLSIVNDHSFKVEGDSLFSEEDSNHRVFVYGKEVDDFHTLDKNAIFTVGVAATQELDRKVARLESELSELKELLRSKNIM